MSKTSHTLRLTLAGLAVLAMARLHQRHQVQHRDILAGHEPALRARRQLRPVWPVHAARRWLQPRRCPLQGGA